MFILRLYNQLVLVKMRFRERDQSSKRPYQRISLGKRKRLVDMITSQGFTLSKAAKKLKLKLTTARLILKKYNQTGDFPMRHFRSRCNQNTKTAPLNVTSLEQVQQQSREGVQQKYEQSQVDVIEESPIVCYYFVDPMGLPYCFPFGMPMLLWL